MTRTVLDFASGAFLLCAVGVLWRRQVAALIRLLVLQGLALTAIAGVLAATRHDTTAIVIVVAVGALKVLVIPAMLVRVHRLVPDARETRPLVNVVWSLVAATLLTLLGYAAARPIVAVASPLSGHAVPVGLASVLLGLFLAATRTRAISQIIGILLVDNGIAAVAFLATAGVPAVVELGSSADLVLAVLVLQVLSIRLHTTLGVTDLDELQELRDR